MVDEENTIQIVDGQTIRLPVITVKGKASSDAVTKKNFSVHEVFQSGVVTTEAVYQSQIGLDAICGVLESKPLAVISYGAEKTGKSWTLFGESHHVSMWDGEAQEVGSVTRTLHDLFCLLKQQQCGTRRFWVQVGMMMILKNDTLHDLLMEGKETGGEFVVRQTVPSDELPCPFEPEPGLAIGHNYPFHIGGGMVVAGLSSLISANHAAVCDAINQGLSSPRDLKGDKVLLINVISTSVGCSTPPSSTSIIIVDCSPVYSKSMHNLRDIANSIANRHRNAEFMKSNLTRLLKHSFCGDCALRLLVHCKVSSFDLDLFDSLSSLTFSSLVMKIQRNSHDVESSPAKSSPPTRKRMKDVASSPFAVMRPSAPFSPATLAAQAARGALAEPEFDDQLPQEATSSSTVSPRKLLATRSPGAPPLFCAALTPPKLNLDSVDSPQCVARRVKSPGPGSRSSPQTFSPTVRTHPFVGEEGGLAVELNTLQHSQITSLLQQLKEKDDSYRKALDTTERMASMLQEEQEKAHRMEQQNGALAKTVRQLQQQINSYLAADNQRRSAEGEGHNLRPVPLPRCGATDDVATFVDCTDEEEQYALLQGLPTGSSAHAIFSPCHVEIPSTMSPTKSASFPPAIRSSPCHTTGAAGGNFSPSVHGPFMLATAISPMARAQTPPPVKSSSDVATSPIYMLNPAAVAAEASPSTGSLPAPEAQQEATKSPPPTAEMDGEDQSSNSSGSGNDDDSTAVQLEVEDLSTINSVCSSDDLSDATERRGAAAKLLQRVNQLEDKVKRYKQLTKSYTAQLNHQTYLANHFSTRLEEEEKKCQEHIQKTIALSTRLDETKKWVRKLKKAVLAEKEKALPMYNETLANRIEVRKLEERRQQEFKWQCDTFIEQQNALNHELQLKSEKVEALEATVQALRQEYNQQLLEMVTHDEGWQTLMANLNPINETAGQPPWPQMMLQFAKEDGRETFDVQSHAGVVTALHMQLRLENEVLRSNIQGVMQVVDHCYEENTRLSNLAARLTHNTVETNEWQHHGVPLDDAGRCQRRKEEKNLKQIANLHFMVVRLKKQLQELGVESQDDSVMVEEEEDETEEVLSPT
eukprot:GGOE01005774.1.p1 GENE.GGOE01005774.1~~GGOE01005774.1.p1  ORF type:complete len:1144 (+),score=317.08 GGOE01005774.1:151-3432(+)